MNTTAVVAQVKVIRGKNLPVWGLSVSGSKTQKVDWRLNPIVPDELVNSGPTNVGGSGVAVDGCGRLAFFVLHSGVDQQNQLHIYAADGTKLTNNTAGHAKLALNGVHGNMEMQVVRVPESEDEWFIIYSLWQPPCLTNPPGSIYCPAQIVYARIKYNAVDGLVIQSDQRQIPIAASKRFIQGKAVSRTVNGNEKMHYLYLAERPSAPEKANEMTLHRFIIDKTGINFGSVSPAVIPAKKWIAGIAGSSIELSPDEKKLAITNRNVGEDITEDIILFDLSKFSSSSYEPSVISIPNLLVFGKNKSIKDLVGEVPCFQFLKNKISQVEFSPSGQYLYLTHGGYPDWSGGLPYNTYLLQIDLKSDAVGTNYTVRMRIEDGGKGNCLGPSNLHRSTNFIQQIQSAYDGKLYFTKMYSSKLFVIPFPDQPLDHSLTPGVVDLSTSEHPNIQMENNALVLWLPENIDGFDYLKPQPSSSTVFQVDKVSGGPDENFTFTVNPFNTSPGYQYQIDLGNGLTQNLTTNTFIHSFDEIGEYEVVLSVLEPDGCVKVYKKSISVDLCSEMRSYSIAAQQFLCATKLSVPKAPNCHATYEWNFGDNTETSRSRSPLHVFPGAGEYVVTVTIQFDCECAKKIVLIDTIQITPEVLGFETVNIQVPTDDRNNIITSSATSYSDTWPLDYHSAEMESPVFVNATTGVWRSDGQFLYSAKRSPDAIDAPPNIRTDGTYTLEQFNWQYAPLEAIPNWIKTNAMTRYDPFSQELENKDILNTYSAALYDHNGQLQTANGVNMRHEEMAFTSFETHDGYPSGNLMFGGESLFRVETFRINSAKSYKAIVEAPIEKFADVDKVDLVLKQFSGVSFLPVLTRSSLFYEVKILCKEEHPTNPAWSVLVFDRTPSEGIWTGEIRLRKVSIADAAGQVANVSHTGKKSLEITADQTFKQPLLHFDKDKRYHLNAWVSAEGAASDVPQLTGNLGIDVILKAENGATVAAVTLLPEGPVIEGWQQVRGSFVCPDNDLTIFLRFKKGSTKAWYDDIRLHPDEGNMKTYVYDTNDLRLRAILDENNFASVFYYDKEGNLYLTKKETEGGIKTISESITHQAPQN